MIAYGIIVLVAGLGLLIVSILLCLGKTNLIHSYHQGNVKEEDKKAFGLAVGLSLMLGAIGLIVASLLAVIISKSIELYVPLLITGVSLLISIILIFIFIKKYNGKIFD